MKQYGIFPIALLALACLAACGRSPQPNYYLLETTQPMIAPLPGDRPGAVLRQVTLPPYLDRDALVLRSGGAVRIVVAEYHLWAEHLNKAVPRLLEANMRPLLQENGFNLLWPDMTDTALQIDADLLRLDGSPGGTANISARWRILDMEGTLLAQGVFARETDAGSSHESMVQTLSCLLADFGRELAQAACGAFEQLAVQSRNSAQKKKGKHR